MSKNDPWLVILIGLFIMIILVAMLMAGCVHTIKTPEKLTNVCILNLADKKCWYDKANQSGADLSALNGWFMLDADDMAEILFKIKECYE